MKSLLSLLFSFCSAFADTVKVSQVTSDANLPASYRQMVNEFVKAGGRGRTFLIEANVGNVAGHYFAVDALPSFTNTDGASYFTRDAKVLSRLIKLQAAGVPIFLHSRAIEADAQVFGDDELGYSIRKAAFPNSEKTFSLSVSPSTRDDILVHEEEHIHHKSPDHPQFKFIQSLDSHVTHKQKRLISRALTELLAYKAQYKFLKAEKNSVNEGAQHNDIFREIGATCGMYVSSIPLRDLSPEMQCQVIDQVRAAISGMGTIEADLLYEYIEFSPCAQNRLDLK